MTFALFFLATLAAFCAAGAYSKHVAQCDTNPWE